MTSDSDHRLQDILDKASLLSASEREAFLETACSGDPKLRHWTEILLSASAADVDPGISLDEGSDADTAAAEESSSRLLERLAALTPEQSRYRVVKEIARGGMGSILRAWDRALRRTLAMKVIREKDRPEGSTDRAQWDARTLGRFLEEAQITGQLHHPGIVPVHELGLNASGQLYFTMRLVKGKTFQEVIDWTWEKLRGWTQTRSLGVLIDVCDALAYAHAKGVVHRDIKPANIMVGKFGETYVMDWGVARVLGKEDRHDLRLKEESSASLTSIHSLRQEVAEETDDSPLITMDGMVVGTPAYMPLEQALGKVDEIDARSDVYSVGALLYHLLSGQMPYFPEGAKISQRTLLAMVIQGPPPSLHQINPDLPAELVAICEKAMARDRDSRYPSTRELAEDLRAFLEQRVVKAYRTGSLIELQMWMTRNKALASALFATLLISLLATLLVTRQNRELQATTSQLQLARVDLHDKAERLQNQATALEQANQEAQKQKEQAIQERKEVLRLADFRRLQDLKARADKLWPLRPERLSDYRVWLREASALEDNLKDHRRLIQGVRARSVTPLPPFRFADAVDSWWHQNLTRLIAELEGFLFEEGEGHRVDIEARKGLAASIVRRSIVDHQQPWEHAIAAIAASPLYGGLQIQPQLGLVPLGADPVSQLWEFWHVESGSRPDRIEESGSLRLTEGDGMVLVLLPAGRFFMGLQDQDSQAPNFDQYRCIEELSPRRFADVPEVFLEAYFLSKFELTEGQWQRLSSTTSPTAPKDRDLLPCTNLSWVDFAATFWKRGLSLPTEAQWEFGARAGTTTPWWFGPIPQSLELVENVDFGPMSPGEPVVIGSYASNAFGLFDVHGNIREWCADGGDDELAEFRVGTGSLDSPSHLRAFRGGSYEENFLSARLGLSRLLPREVLAANLGARPVRPLEQARPPR
jgi:serine/threonine protein kinase/formylglycine-generating enzyme required for sulfatase activity